MMTSKQQEKDWRAEDDANILIQAESIISDKNRKLAALKKVRDVIKRKKEEAKVAEKVAKKSTKKVAKKAKITKKKKK